MGADQQFCLRWNNFHTNITSAFESLRDDEDFVDITLACEGRQIKAHKMVLSACSPYFRSLLRGNPCQHPIVFLKDVSFANLTSILDFMYHGEVNVSHNELATFLKTAEALRVRGLAEDEKKRDGDTCTESSSPPPPRDPPEPCSPGRPDDLPGEGGGGVRISSAGDGGGPDASSTPSNLSDGPPTKRQRRRSGPSLNTSITPSSEHDLTNTDTDSLQQQSETVGRESVKNEPEDYVNEDDDMLGQQQQHQQIANEDIKLDGFAGSNAADDHSEYLSGEGSMSSRSQAAMQQLQDTFNTFIPGMTGQSPGPGFLQPPVSSDHGRPHPPFSLEGVQGLPPGISALPGPSMSQAGGANQDASGQGAGPPSQQHWAGAPTATSTSSYTSSSITTTNIHPQHHSSSADTSSNTNIIAATSTSTCNNNAAFPSKCKTTAGVAGASSGVVGTVMDPKASPNSSCSSSYGGSPSYSGGEDSKRAFASNLNQAAGGLPLRRSSLGSLASSSASNAFGGPGLGGSSHHLLQQQQDEEHSLMQHLGAVGGGSRSGSFGGGSSMATGLGVGDDGGMRGGIGIGGGITVAGGSSIRRHLTGEEVQCNVCGRTLCNKYVLKVHIRDMHRPRVSHQCQHCNRCYSTINSLRVHVSTMHNKGSASSSSSSSSGQHYQQQHQGLHHHQQQQQQQQQQVQHQFGAAAAVLSTDGAGSVGTSTSQPTCSLDPSGQNQMMMANQQQQQHFGGLMTSPGGLHAPLHQQQQMLQQQQLGQHLQPLLSPKIEFNLQEPPI